jgi:FAD/FMN-containing dehydrogenase/Fe-S oxidoreductase
MDQPPREHLADDLRGLVKGELLFDDISRALYSTDASIFQVRPLGVVVPRDEEDVQALVRYAAEQHLSLIPRGGGSGVAGESLGTGLIVDLSRHMRAILEVGTDTVRVQPGVVYRDLETRLAREGRRFAPDPASGAQCTVGGMLATNASGARCMRFGYTRDHVDRLRVVFDNAEVASVGREPRRRPAEDGRLGVIVTAVAELIEGHVELIQSSRPRTPYNRCGYLLHDVLGADQLDLSRLLVGSEGTLALFTEATLRTLPLPEGRALLLLGFTTLDAALRAAQRSMPSGPTACELIDRRVLGLARSNDAEVAALIPTAIEAVLLVEYESDTPTGAAEAALELREELYESERLAALAVSAQEEDAINRLWRLREVSLPSLYGLRHGPQPIPFVEDVGVPPEELPVYLHRVQEVLQRRETTASFVIHAGAGQVHTRPFLDLQKPEEVDKLWALAEEIHGLALELGGTVSTQHGTGLARTPWVARQFSRLYPVFRELKAIFDPHRLFNPGKIVGPDPGLPAWPLRLSSKPKENEPTSNGVPEEPPVPSESAAIDDTPAPVPEPPEQPPPLHLRWQTDEMRTEYLSCNGCGHCRTESPGQRMCPIFRATHAEAATPRAKANLLRHLLTETGDTRALSADAVRDVADLCVNCKMCALECPAHTNIPKLMLEAKATHVAEHGLNRGDWVLSRTESFAALGSALAFLANPALRNRAVRWLLEKVFGVSRHRHLPPFEARSFLRRAARRGWTRRRPRSDRPRVAYYIDVFANYNDPLLAEAVVLVLQHNGVEVYVPPGQHGCGIAPLTYGDVDLARETALHNVRLLADLVRDGYEIISSEPTAVLMLRHDYLDLLDDPDAKLVADHTLELTAYLRELHEQGRLDTGFRPLPYAVGHHVPCHLKALGRPAAGPGLLALIPEMRVHTIDVSCSGMAGTFGLKAENYEVSLEAGRPMLDELRRPRVLFGSTECSTCRMQMEEGSGKRTLHPAQYLALAYGLLPEIEKRLR